jgi:hypothetical protein
VKLPRYYDTIKFILAGSLEFPKKNRFFGGTTGSAQMSFVIHGFERLYGMWVSNFSKLRN